MVKGPSGQPYAGVTLYTAGSINANPAVHSVITVDTFGLNTSKIVTMRSYSSAPVGTKMTLKLENGHYFVDVAGRHFRVLLASVTYFKAKPNDQVSVNLPEDDSQAEWAALEAAL